MSLQCYIITLLGNNHSEKMTSECLNSATKFNWNIKIWPATNGLTVDNNTWEKINLKPRLDKVSMDKPGVQGCFLSHWFLWNHCVNLNKDIIILEHDAIITDFYPNIRSNNQIVKLHKRYKIKESWGATDNEVGTWTPSAHAYLITPNQAKKLITFSYTNGAMPADIIIGSNVVDFTHLDFDLVTRNDHRISTTQRLE
jgi:GR25 family glycosyltransferase involved in LPS biosynthesis